MGGAGFHHFIGLRDAALERRIAARAIVHLSSMRSDDIGSSPMHLAASPCSTMAATIGGVPRAEPTPVSPLSVPSERRHRTDQKPAEAYALRQAEYVDALRLRSLG
jgi:hypothetical protein